ncbi:MAG: DUF86 domain-containing protein, partial [Actinobacteria bacterium]|nr:DUF86 domain-containing protein [Actinomycetota bacterium]
MVTKKDRDDDVYIYDILTSLDLIEEYTRNLSEDEFASNRLMQDAIVRRLEIIGEAAKRMSNKTLASYPDIPWSQIKGMRDKLI